MHRYTMSVPGRRHDDDPGLAKSSTDTGRRMSRAGQRSILRVSRVAPRMLPSGPGLVTVHAGSPAPTTSTAAERQTGKLDIRRIIAAEVRQGERSS